MKKIYSFALIIAAALSSLTSCQKDTLNPGNDSLGQGLTSFVAYMDNDATKTTIDGLKVSWVDGDEISVNGKTFVATVDAENSAKAIFNLKAGQTAPTGSTFRAYYPTSTFVSTSYTQRYKLQGTQTYNGSNVSTIDYMYAQTANSGADITFNFKHVNGIIALDLVGDETITSIQVTAPTSNYLYGTINNLSYSSDGVISYSAFTTTGRGTTVTLDCGKGVALNETTPERFYISLPEKSYSTLTFKINTASGKTKTITSTKACPVVKGELFTLPQIKVSFPVLTFNANIAVSDIETVSSTTSQAVLTITPEDAEQYYVYAVESPGYVSKYSTPLELAQADIDFWKGQGATSLSMLINAGIAVKGTYSELQNNLKPESSYVPYAYAIDADFNVSPAVIGQSFTTPEYVLPPSSTKYEDYLGQWTLGTNLITVEEKVKGETYSISGLLYQSYPTFGYENAPVEAIFNNGYFQLKEQVTGTVVPVGTYGDCDIVLTGEFAQGTTKYKYYPFNGNTPMILFTGNFDGDKTIKVEANACPYGTFTGMAFAWIIKTGSNAGKGNYFTTMNITDWVKYEPVTGPTPEGQWRCASVTDYWGEKTYTDWVMTIESDGMGYKINNFDQGFDAFLETQVAGLRSTPPTAAWNSTDKTLTIAKQTETGISAGTNLYWTGLDGNTEVDIVLAFDFDNNMCVYQTAIWGAFLPDATQPGFYTLYNGPEMVFTKVNAETVRRNLVEFPKQIAENTKIEFSSKATRNIEL